MAAPTREKEKRQPAETGSKESPPDTRSEPTLRDTSNRQRSTWPTSLSRLTVGPLRGEPGTLDPPGLGNLLEPLPLRDSVATFAHEEQNVLGTMQS